MGLRQRRGTLTRGRSTLWPEPSFEPSGGQEDSGSYLLSDDDELAEGEGEGEEEEEEEEEDHEEEIDHEEEGPIDGDWEPDSV